METADIEAALTLLGELLHERSLHYEVVAIGGAALLLIGIIERPTKDLDLVAIVDGNTLTEATQPLPAPLAEAVSDVGRLLGLPELWMNGGPASLLQFGLPTGFMERVHRRDYGALSVLLASRWDQIHFKLYAATDDRPGGKHHVDLQKLTPSADELLDAAAWAKTHDTSEEFATLIAQVLKTFGVER